MSKHYAIKCTNCAGPLNILGGGRVNTLTCSYCHSILDMNDHYKVLAKFNNIKRPQGPFQIGMCGNIKGVEWTIIGWIAYRTAEFPAEEWSEFFLYSPTHGYAWLVYENNKVYFSKRVRDFDLLAWQEKKPKTLFYHKGHYLQKEASYLTYIDYVEGELNWVAKFGDKFSTWDYNGVGFKTLNIEKTNEELEVYLTERLDKGNIYNAFGLEYQEKSKITQGSNNITITYEEDIDNTPSNNGWKVLIFILTFIILFSFFSHNQLLSFDTNKDTNKYTFQINSNAFLTHIAIDSSSNLKESSLSLYKENKKIFYIDKATVYYIKKHLYHNWLGKGKHTDIYLNLPKGKYTIIFKQSDNYRKHITITEKVIRLKYILSLFIVMILIILYNHKKIYNGNIFLVVFTLTFIILGYKLIGTGFIYGVLIFLPAIYMGYISEDDGEDKDD